MKRSGGIVSIAPIVEEIKRIQSGVDRTASELTIQRLQQEIKELDHQLSVTQSKQFNYKYSFLSRLLIPGVNDTLKQLTGELDEIKALINKKKKELEMHRRLLDSTY